MVENRGYHVAVVGATGAVGKEMMKTLERLEFPIASILPLSSKRSAGTKVVFKGEEVEVKEATPESFEDIDLALFSAGGSVSKKLASEAVNRGAIVVDNTSAFRMDDNVPLVVPEVNPHHLEDHQGIISNPNCSTIQMVAALEPVRRAFGLKKIIVSTYQAVSGAGADAIDEMYTQSQQVIEGENAKAKLLPVAGDKKHYQIAFNAVPQIDLFQENGYTFEEMKMINETKKITGDTSLQVAATCVRLPIETGHSESVYFELEKDGVTREDILAELQQAEGITVMDNPEEQLYPMAVDATGKDDVFVGRLRPDLDNTKGFHCWVVSDNLLKGAALNSVQIAQTLVKKGILK
ncbi:aspartate-semialdehyde dehydrogenase [Alteribacter populi]|uniref:aspartate-semialdehyde dehydrogenase n=1 Tax=Alteribacter populi TaxID=2011011 RepID=UPI000BBB6491|nr:aspartate-semialdehyde dehydrogenase [Alteribacter populi]